MNRYKTCEVFQMPNIRGQGRFISAVQIRNDAILVQFSSIVIYCRNKVNNTRLAMSKSKK